MAAVAPARRDNWEEEEVRTFLEMAPPTIVNVITPRLIMFHFYTIQSERTECANLPVLRGDGLGPGHSAMAQPLNYVDTADPSTFHTIEQGEHLLYIIRPFPFFYNRPICHCFTYLFYLQHRICIVKEMIPAVLAKHWSPNHQKL